MCFRPLAILIAGFAALCEVAPECRAGIDINCDGIRPAVCRWLSALAFGAATVILVRSISSADRG